MLKKNGFTFLKVLRENDEGLVINEKKTLH